MDTLLGCITSLHIYHICCADVIFPGQTLYPIVNLDNVNNAFHHGLQLIKEAVLHELTTDNVTSDWVEQWSPPLHLLDADISRRALVDGAWDTAYERYCSWRKEYNRNHPY